MYGGQLSTICLAGSLGVLPIPRQLVEFESVPITLNGCFVYLYHLSGLASELAENFYVCCGYALKASKRFELVDAECGGERRKECCDCDCRFHLVF